MATSSSSAAHSNSYRWYDIFINHRGPDVKKTFARSLYLRLISNGLTAFLDQEELQPGYNFSDQIENAIKTASIHVAIFSLRYAESSWCLNELLSMLESKAPIVPVFYGVTPADVRWTGGKYDRDLQTLANKRGYDSNTTEKWKNALHQVANNKGFELEVRDRAELELELLDKVVISLLEMVKMLNLRPNLYVAEYPTGIDYKLKDFEDTVLFPQRQSQKPRILGIVGFGGIGKTTLAKHFFNRKKSGYQSACFLSDVKDKSATNSLNLLQSQLYKSLTRFDKQVNSVDEGKDMLIGPLKSSHALIILDDVDDEDQVQALLPVQIHDLHSGSLILITSRHKDVLRISRVENSAIYTLTGLDIQHSLELFCSHAFNQLYPLPDFESLVDKFLESCKGLPLSLKVIGALLYGKDIIEWEEELDCLQQTLPQKIEEKLKISYDSLNEQEQQIFLDIACFMVGHNRDTAISIWDGSCWNGRRGFRNLQDKCLVEADSQSNVIYMHDHLRDLGRYLAEKSSPRRLWRWTEKVNDGLLDRSSHITIRGIRMVRGEYDDAEIALCGRTLRRLCGRTFRRLQILHTDDIHMERILRRMKKPNLLWLTWKKYPYTSLPSWLPMKNLRILRVSGSVLTTLWHRRGESQALLQLPEDLKELWTDECVQLKNISGVERLIQLRQLVISGCSQLEELPSMDSLVSLEELWADRCVKLKSIMGLGQMTELRYLIVSGCFELEELQTMGTMVSLEKLVANECVKLKSIQGMEQCTKLRQLHLSGCSQLEKLPSMETLIYLEMFIADRCVKLKNISGVERLTQLRQLVISGCSQLEELPSMDSSVSLEELWADRCVKLKSIMGLGQMTKLRYLIVSGCFELEELQTMGTMVSLEKLAANECVKLKSIQGMEQCTKLRELHLSGCAQLEKLPSMETLIYLEMFIADRCVKLKSIEGLAHCTELRFISVTGCSELQQLPNMEKLEFLKSLWVDGCVKLINIPGLAHCTRLLKLVLTGCCELQELPSLKALVSLEELWANNCVKLKRIKGLARARKLRYLSVSYCSELEELPSMETLVSLEKLVAVGCLKLKSIRGLLQLTKLRELNVFGCPDLKEVEDVEHITWLKVLDLSMCPKLQCLM